MNLEDGGVSDRLVDPTTGLSGADVVFANHADRARHAVVVQAEEGVEIAFIDHVNFDDLSGTDVDKLIITLEPLDLPLDAGDTVVVRTDTGAVYNIGNAVESATSVAISYERIQ